MEVSFTLLGWFLSVIAAIGNGFVIFLVVKTRLVYSSSNWFVLSLAIADLFLGVFVFPLGFLCNSSSSCNVHVYMSFHWFFLHSSVANLCTLTWDRYVAIVYPFKYQSSISVRRPSLLILSAWVICVLISLFLLVGMYATPSETAHKVLRLAGVFGFDVICCVYLFYAVLRILLVARSHSLEDQAIKRQVLFNRRSKTANLTNTSQKRNRKRSAASFIAVIVLFFLGCYVVINYLVICLAFSQTCYDVVPNLGQVVTVLVVLNSAVNPLVYGFLKKDIKTELQRLVCRKKTALHCRDSFKNEKHLTPIMTMEILR